MSETTLIQFNGHKNLGDEYHGNDEGRTLDMKIGQPMLVSVEKAKQLIKDFGRAFSYVKEDTFTKKDVTNIVEKIVGQNSDNGKDPKKKPKVRRTVIRRRKGKKASRRKKGG